MKKILLVDISSLIFRAYFALPFMSNSKGQPTNAIYGFVNMFWMVKKKIPADLIIACGDCREKTFREELFPAYKAQRQQMPDEFYSQLPFIERFLEICGVPLIKVAGYEADDVIASIISQMPKGYKFYILTSDKDLLQLVGDNVVVCNYHRGNLVIFDKQKVKEKYGVWPEQFVDFLSIVGDNSDNIVGVKGIGPKTATKLLNKYYDVEELFLSIDQLPLKIKKSLLDSKEQIFLNKHLIKVKDDLPLSLNLLPKENHIDQENLYKFYEELEFSSLIKRQFADSNSFSTQDNYDKHLTLHNYLPDFDCLNCEDIKFCFILMTDKELFLTFDGENIYFESLYRCDLKKCLNLSVKKIVLSKLKSMEEINSSFVNLIPLDLFLHISNCSLPVDLILKKYKEGSVICAVLFNQIRTIYQQLPSQLLRLLWDIEAKVFEVTSYMSRVGVKLDREFLVQLLDQIQEQIDKVEQEIFQLLGCKINLNSPKQLSFMLFEKLRLPVIKKAKNYPSTNEQVLRKLRSAHPVIDKILFYRELNKIVTAYINPLLSLTENSDKIYTKFSLINTQTGRITAIEPNLQTIPIRSEWGKKIRQAFVSRFDEGYIVSGDYSQIELRVLAHITGEDNLILAFNKDQDIHKLTAAKLFDKPLSEVTEQERDIAKRVNFGIVYGITPQGLVEDIGLDYVSAKRFIELYFQMYPKVKEFIDTTISKAKIDGFVKTMFGRIRYLPELKSRIKHIREFGCRAAVNTVIQGSAAEIIKLAMISVYQWIKDKKSKLILQVHDELVFDVESTELEELLAEVKDRMENVVELSVPLKVNIAYGKNWLEAKN